MGISQLLISQADSNTLLYIAMACYGVGFGFLFPSVNSLLIDSTTAEVRGKAYGYFYAFFSWRRFRLFFIRLAVTWYN